MAEVILKKGHDKPLQKFHPWIFSGAIDRVEGTPSPGEVIDVFSFDGQWLARGWFSPQSQIRVRILTKDADEQIDSNFFKLKILRAYEWRKKIGIAKNGAAFRLINAESDGIPGLVIDVYKNAAVCQFSSVGAEKMKNEFVSILSQFKGIESVYERSDIDSRKYEGLPLLTGLLYGKEIPDNIQIEENGIKFLIDVKKGHKTGFYLDQRLNRQKIIPFSKNALVLNCFSYTGGFGIYAAKGGAERVINIDSSSFALELARQNFLLNGIEEEKVEFFVEDTGKYLRECRDRGQKFDLVVLDPPKFAESKSHVYAASRAYKDINLLAIKLCKKDGILFTFSCSGHVGMDLFEKIVASAAVDASRRLQIIDRLFQSPDHPVDIAFPEGGYLKGLICRVL